MVVTDFDGDDAGGIVCAVRVVAVDESVFVVIDLVVTDFDGDDACGIVCAVRVVAVDESVFVVVDLVVTDFDGDDACGIVCAIRVVAVDFSVSVVVVLVVTDFDGDEASGIVCAVRVVAVVFSVSVVVDFVVTDFDVLRGDFGSVFYDPVVVFLHASGDSVIEADGVAIACDTRDVFDAADFVERGAAGVSLTGTSGFLFIEDAAVRHEDVIGVWGLVSVGGMVSADFVCAVFASAGAVGGIGGTAVFGDGAGEGEFCADISVFVVSETGKFHICREVIVGDAEPFGVRENGCGDRGGNGGRELDECDVSVCRHVVGVTGEGFVGVILVENDF